MRLRGLLAIAALSCHPKAPPSEASPSASTAPDASFSASATRPAPAAAVTLVNVGGGRFRVENGGASVTRLRSAAAIERRTDAGWREVPIDLHHGYRLVERCPPAAEPVATCVPLAPREELDPARWTGLDCSGQCNDACRANSYEGPGTFRLVVTSCDGARVEGLPFEMPSPRGPAALDRWAVSRDVVSATVMRLELTSGKGAAPAEEVAGFAVRPGTERPLDAPAISSLRGLLEAPRGFDDTIVTRCATRQLAGVRLVRQLPSTDGPRRQTVELALDFACQRLFVAFGEGTRRVTLAPHFGPSRPAFVAWTKAALRGDRELAGLR